MSISLKTENKKKPLTNTYRSLEKIGVRLIDDNNYTEYINSQNADWRRHHVMQGDLTSFDGLSLRYYYAMQPEPAITNDLLCEKSSYNLLSSRASSKVHNAKGCIVILHGYCGFWGKFHEMAEYYWQAGYDVFFLEQRGHGYSGRQTDDKDMVHVNDYTDYIKDLKMFMDNIVLPKTLSTPHILFAHSMGGAVATLFLEDYPDYFSAAILSSPMLSINTGNISKATVYLLRAKIKILHRELQPFPGGKRFDGIPAFATSSTKSAVRYKYIFEQRLADTHYHTYMLSNGWGCASFKATSKALKNAHKISIPILLLTAGNDTLVTMDGCTKFKKKAASVEHIHFENAKHELFNDTDDVRRNYYSRIFYFTEENFEKAKY